MIMLLMLWYSAAAKTFTVFYSSYMVATLLGSPAIWPFSFNGFI